MGRPFVMFCRTYVYHVCVFRFDCVMTLRNSAIFDAKLRQIIHSEFYSTLISSAAAAAASVDRVDERPKYNNWLSVVYITTACMSRSPCAPHGQTVFHWSICKETNSIISREMDHTACLKVDTGWMLQYMHLNCNPHWERSALEDKRTVHQLWGKNKDAT